MGAATVLGAVGCASKAITPVTSSYTLMGEPTREELHTVLESFYNQVNSGQEFLDRIHDHAGPVITLVESPDRNTDHQRRQIYEWNAMRYFTKLRNVVGHIEANDETALWVYLNIGDDLNQTALSDLVVRNSYQLVERPQIFLIGGGSESPLERGLGAKSLCLEHQDVDSAVRRDALWLEKRILGEE
mgnify:FL=1